MVSHLELGSDPPIGSDRESGRDSDPTTPYHQTILIAYCTISIPLHMCSIFLCWISASNITSIIHPIKLNLYKLYYYTIQNEFIFI